MTHVCLRAHVAISSIVDDHVFLLHQQLAVHAALIRFSLQFSMTPKDDSLDTQMGTGKPPNTLPLNAHEQQQSSPPDYQSSIIEENEDENVPDESST